MNSYEKLLVSMANADVYTLMLTLTLVNLNRDYADTKFCFRIISPSYAES